MNRFEDLSEVPQHPLVLAVGAFDGLHRGHVAVIDAAKTLAAQHAAETGVLRFHPHPAKVLDPDSAPHLLSSEATLAERLMKLDVSIHLRLPFTHDLSRLSPEAFLTLLFDRLPRLKGLVVGSNWRFGRHGKGDFRLLTTFAATRGIQVAQAPDTEWKDSLISSTRIRQAVVDGHLEAAAHMLARPFRLTGTVRDGKKYGRALGFPTANFQPGQECLPPEGVYAMRVGVETEPDRLGAGYITHHPALVEVHLLDFEGDLYGQSLNVDLLAFRRPATPIADPEILRSRIQRDVDGIRTDYPA